MAKGPSEIMVDSIDVVVGSWWEVPVKRSNPDWRGIDAAKQIPYFSADQVQLGFNLPPGSIFKVIAPIEYGRYGIGWYLVASYRHGTAFISERHFEDMSPTNSPYELGISALSSKG